MARSGSALGNFREADFGVYKLNGDGYGGDKNKRKLLSREFIYPRIDGEWMEEVSGLYISVASDSTSRGVRDSDEEYPMRSWIRARLRLV